MKNLIYLCLLFFSLQAQGQKKELTGAFFLKRSNVNTLWLFKDGYASQIQYRDSTYINTKGGPFLLERNSIVIHTEYNDRHPDSVGLKMILPLTIQDHSLQIGPEKFSKAKSNDQELDGVWRISGRQVDNKINQIPKGDRKTIKILVDGYFQWVAINPAEKGFYGTGGGKYLFSAPKYEENILFFSRDNSRIGAILGFKGELIREQWHHSGNSSKGDPIHEIWSKEKKPLSHF